MAIIRLEVSNPEYTPCNNQIVTVHSSNLQGRHDINIYNVDALGKDLPVIILLHGVYGNSWVWSHLGGIESAYQKVKASLSIPEFILAMPSDGGLFDGSGYLPTLKHGNYESWIMEDVIQAVQQTVESVTTHSALYISGLSMGGYGALRLGAKHADKFKGISAHSAITQITELNQFVDTPLSEYECEQENEADILYWMQKNKDILPEIRFDCGTEDELYSGNLAFTQCLTSANIPHQFYSFPGGHEWSYWHNHVQKTIQFFAQLESRKDKA
ncbi:alpha/beta hydrolase [Catenovulum maritimum]|uniref:ATPase n=1 Tax=Catenovulum maritimum TaxID=1513271 RepID=A0A0J8GSZ3_9ALTE|nr:alpha/beta hydrolase-fold protein [Catenovulum maritimum]KMT63828.1 ATPase [Catenovulum maritimum]